MALLPIMPSENAKIDDDEVRELLVTGSGDETVKVNPRSDLETFKA
jgi:hypothetical protein